MRDWFRNETWTSTIECIFEERLRRARHKGQYLRIQACTLARSDPEVALKLLDRYFELPQQFDRAQAHVDRATALLTLGKIDEAIASCESALETERSFPNAVTQASIELPFLIVKRELRDRYQRALEVLKLSERRLAFPADRFRWHAAQALIASDLNDHERAGAHAERALAAAEEEYSGIRYHPKLGLVGDGYEEVIAKLKCLTPQ